MRAAPHFLVVGDVGGQRRDAGWEQWRAAVRGRRVAVRSTLPAPAPFPHGTSAEQHRQLVRDCLRVLLAEGYSPLSFFARDQKKYFYLAELLALVDLSLVGAAGANKRAGRACVEGGRGGLNGWAGGGAATRDSHACASCARCAAPPPAALPLTCPPFTHALARAPPDREDGGAVLAVGRERGEPGHRAPPPRVL